MNYYDDEDDEMKLTSNWKLTLLSLQDGQDLQRHVKCTCTFITYSDNYDCVSI